MITERRYSYRHLTVDLKDIPYRYYVNVHDFEGCVICAQACPLSPLLKCDFLGISFIYLTELAFLNFSNVIGSLS